MVSEAPISGGGLLLALVISARGVLAREGGKEVSDQARQGVGAEGEVPQPSEGLLQAQPGAR